jgi:ADP-ribose pyrophosphatase YjhB (NUDIX family)
MAGQKFYYRNSDAPTANQPTSIGVVALIEQDTKLLLEKRVDSDRWAIIGGAIELNESLTEGLQREVLEETGLKVCSYELFGTFSDPSRKIEFPDGRVKRIITMAYRVVVEPYEKLICSEESLELRFVDKSELGTFNIAETHLPIIEQYLRGSSLVLE